jgi:hypothetical protein
MTPVLSSNKLTTTGGCVDPFLDAVVGSIFRGAVLLIRVGSLAISLIDLIAKRQVYLLAITYLVLMSILVGLL